MTRTPITVLLIVLLLPLLATAGDINQDLIEAAKKGDTAAVKALLARGADVNPKDNKGRTPLMQAAMKGHTAAARALLAAGADVNAKGRGDWTALMTAAGKGHTAVVKLLKKAGAKK